MDLRNIQVGDEVVISGYRARKYIIDKVTRITKTRVTVGNSSYMKSNGYRVGDGESWHPVRIVIDKTPEQAREINKQMDVELEQKRLARLICDSYKQISRFPVETLQQAVKLLMLED